MNAIVPLNTQQAIESVELLAHMVKVLKDTVFIQGSDYGVIPGTNTKPVLLLPGMEKLLRALRLRPEYVLLDNTQDFDKPLFYFRYECRLVEIDTGLVISTAIGSANSHEGKWRWRDGKPVCPACGAAAVMRSRQNPGYFCWAKLGGCGVTFKADDQRITSQKAGRIENPDIADQVNTIDKIAQKRALSSAIKGAANVSEFFTVDLEDSAEYRNAHRRDENVVEGEIVPDEPQKTGSGNGKAPELPASQRPWTVETLKALAGVLSLFENESNYYAAIANYRNPEHEEYLLPADLTLLQAEARIRFYRSRTGKANQSIFSQEKARDAFIGMCMAIVKTDQDIRDALDEIADDDHPISGLTSWKGEKVTAWAAILAYAGEYQFDQVPLPSDASPMTREVVRLICDYIGSMPSDAGDTMSDAEQRDENERLSLDQIPF